MKNIFIFAVCIFAATLLISPGVMAKVEYEGPDDFIHMENFHMFFGAPEGSCTSDEVIDLTDNVGKEYEDHVTDANGDFKWGFLDGELNCLRDRQITVAEGFLYSLFLKDVAQKDRNPADDHVDLNTYYKGDYKVVYAHAKELENAMDGFFGEEALHKSPSGIIKFVVDDNRGNNFYTVQNKPGEHTLRNKTEWKLYLECMPTAADYDSCEEINFQDINGGEMSIAKGKVLTQTATISRRVLIRDTSKKEGIPQEINQESSPVEKISAPNTGFSKNYENSTLISLASFLTLLTFGYFVKRKI